MDISQDGLGPHRSIIMPSRPIIRSRVKKIKQAFQAYVQEWTNEEERLGPMEAHEGKRPNLLSQKKS